MAAVHGLSAVTLIAAKTIRAADKDEWENWLVGQSTTHGGDLWRLLDPGPAGRPGAGHSHVIHLEPAQIERFDTDTTAGRDGAGGGHAETQRDSWRRVGTGIQLDANADVTGLIVAQVLCADPRRVAEWDAWYDAQHLPDMMASGAFVAGSRWARTEPRDGTANHLTIYEISGITVEEAIDRSAAVMPGLVAAGRKHECHAGALTWALQRVR